MTDSRAIGGVPSGGAGQPAGRPWWSIQPPPPADPIPVGRAYAEVLGVFAVFFAASIIAGAESLVGRYPAPTGSWAIFTPSAVSEIANAVLAVTVVVLLSARRGITPRSLGLSWPRKPGGKVAVAQSYRIGVWAVMVLLVGGLITTALATGHLAQPTRQDGSYVLYATAASVAAGVIEEVAVLAFVVTTLRQARRSLPEIVVVAVLLRCSYHVYYGPGIAGIAVWAAIFVWLFLRTGSVLPLVVVHFVWDASIFVGQQPALKSAFTVGRLAAYVLLPVIAGLTLLVEMGRGTGAGQPPGGMLPGYGQEPGARDLGD